MEYLKKYKFLKYYIELSYFQFIVSETLWLFSLSIGFYENKYNI